MSLKKKRYIGILVSVGIVIILGLSFIAGQVEQGAGVMRQKATPIQNPNMTSVSGLADKDCLHPYAKTSIWNMPIDWDHASIHPLSNAMINTFFNGTGWIGSDTTQYAPNIYFVDHNTPLVSVKLWDKRRFRDAFDDKSIHYGQPGETIMMPLPQGAQPSPGTDGQLVVVNLDTGEEWGIIKGEISENGSWTAGGVYRYHVQNSGIPPKGFGQRGAGIGQYAGVVRPCEIERGHIDHAVTIAYDYPCAPGVCEANGWPEVIPPFTKTDGRGSSHYDIPEGARLVIRPEISKDKITKACAGVKGCILWAEAMQEYGGFIVDNSGHPKTYAEGDATANWNPKIWSSDMLKNIPPSWYAILDWNSDPAGIEQ